MNAQIKRYKKLCFFSWTNAQNAQNAQKSVSQKVLRLVVFKFFLLNPHLRCCKQVFTIFVILFLVRLNTMFSFENNTSGRCVLTQYTGVGEPPGFTVGSVGWVAVRLTAVVGTCWNRQKIPTFIKHWGKHRHTHSPTKGSLWTGKW